MNDIIGGRRNVPSCGSDASSVDFRKQDAPHTPQDTASLAGRSCRYVGCFFNPRELRELADSEGAGTLEFPIQFPHVTFVYRPEHVDESLFGTPVEVKAVGYGNDGRCEGLLVELHCDNPVVARMARAIEVPHITLSVAEGVEPVETRNLCFKPLKHPFKLTAPFGGFYHKDQQSIVATDSGALS